jgi:hypothetical protein
VGNGPRASWGPERLRNELRGIELNSFEVDLIGFQSDQLKTILAGLGSSGLTDPDSVPDVLEQPVARLGDVWLLGDHRVAAAPARRMSRKHWRDRSLSLWSPIRLIGSATSCLASAPRPRSNPAYVDVDVRRWQVFTGRAARHQASGQLFDERTDRQDHDQSGAAHGEKAFA